MRKKMRYIVLMAVVLLLSSFSLQALDMGLVYNSTYYWRGISFYGPYNGETSSSRGVFFPWVGQGFGDIYLTLSGEVASEMLGDGATDLEKAWLGLDFIASWSKSLGPMTLGFRGAYFLYPNSRKDEYGGAAADFAEARMTLSFDSVPLTPTLLVSYYYRIDTDKTPVNAEDLYIELSAGDSISLTDTASLNVGGSISAFNYASAGFDFFALNDIKLYSGLSVSAGDGLSFGGKYSFGIVVPDELVNWTSRFQHWATFSVTYSM